jgi:hypothetical protein
MDSMACFYFTGKPIVLASRTWFLTVELKLGKPLLQLNTWLQYAADTSPEAGVNATTTSVVAKGRRPAGNLKGPAWAALFYCPKIT